MKKAICMIVLVSMTLHCLSRLEVLSYVYGHRVDIAFAVGLCAEKEISTCKADYFQGVTLAIQDVADKTDHSGLVTAQEIQLATPPSVLQSLQICTTDIATGYSPVVFPILQNLDADIFHPPLI